MFWAALRWLIILSLARFNHSSRSRSPWLIAIRSILPAFRRAEVEIAE
jgi:hypothetical protein